MWVGGLDRLLALELKGPAVGASRPGWHAEEKPQEQEPGDEKAEEAKPPARQNLLLRRFFREQYMSFSGDGVYLNRTFMERYVDRQIDHFLEETRGRLDELKRHADSSCSNWQELSGSPDNGRHRDALKDSLKALENVADDLGDRLASIFRGMDYKAELPPLPEDGRSPEFGSTLSRLKTESESVRAAMGDYFYKPSHTVHFGTLREDDILARLYRLKKVAEGLRKSL